MTKMHASAVSGAHIPKALWRYAKAAARDIALLYFIPLLVVFSDSAAESVRESLKMCAAALIPSLFPYLVLTALISRCGTTEHIGRAIGQPFSMLFGLPGSLAFSFIIGMCAGYPAGAAAVCEAYRDGRCTADEAERGCALLNNTGPGLTVALLGTTLLGDRRLGIIIYLAQLLSVLTLGALHGGIHNIGKRKKENRLGNVCAGQRVRYDKSLSDSTATHSSVLRVLPESVASALSATLTVVSLVTVFSLLRARCRAARPCLHLTHRRCTAAYRHTSAVYAARGQRRSRQRGDIRRYIRHRTVRHGDRLVGAVRHDANKNADARLRSERKIYYPGTRCDGCPVRRIYLSAAVYCRLRTIF